MSSRKNGLARQATSGIANPGSAALNTAINAPTDEKLDSLMGQRPEPEAAIATTNAANLASPPNQVPQEVTPEARGFNPAEASREGAILATQDYALQAIEAKTYGDTMDHLVAAHGNPFEYRRRALVGVGTGSKSNLAAANEALAAYGIDTQLAGEAADAG
jgi:hypothetical protein